MLSAAYSELASSRDAATAFKDKALPAAQEAYEMTQKAFEQGELTLIDVLDAQRTLFDLQRRYLDALRRYHLATTEIETLVGRPVGELEPQD
jgi:cobalt-zinc-cadmium efflux system outer membrane protein